MAPMDKSMLPNNMTKVSPIPAIKYVFAKSSMLPILYKLKN